MNREEFCKFASVLGCGHLIKRAGDDDTLKYTKKLGLGGMAGGGLLGALLAAGVVRPKTAKEALETIGVGSAVFGFNGGVGGATIGGIVDALRYLKS